MGFELCVSTCDKTKGPKVRHAATYSHHVPALRQCKLHTPGVQNCSPRIHEAYLATLQPEAPMTSAKSILFLRNAGGELAYTQPGNFS